MNLEISMIYETMGIIGTCTFCPFQSQDKIEYSF